MPPAHDSTGTTRLGHRLRANNFDLIRLVLAAVVAMVHVAVLSRETGLAWIPRVLSSALAVKAFFVVSGFLIVMSYERSTSVLSYAGKRVRRLYPGYAVVILLSAVLLVLASSRPPSEYFSTSWWQYLGANLLFLNFLEPNLPGVFDNNPVTNVNGALWTLKVEVMFYLVVPLIVFLCRRFGWARVLGVTYAGSIVYTLVALSLAATTGNDVYEVLARQLPGQMSYFAAGAALYYGHSMFERRRATFVVPAIAVIVLDQFHALPVFEPAAIGILVIAAAFSRYAGAAGRYGDFSYGLYILHFPVIQAIVQAGWFRGRPGALLVVTLGTAFAGAVLLWHLIEKRWLLESSHYKSSE